MLERLIELLNGSQTLAVFASVASIASFLLAVHVFIVGRRGRRLRYLISRTPLLSGVSHSEVKVLFRGREVGPEVTVAVMRVWNNGELPIKAEHVLRPLYIVSRPPVDFLDVCVTKRTRRLIDLQAVASRNVRGRAALSFRLLEYGDGAAIRVIYAGPADHPLGIEGEIEGQREIREHIDDLHQLLVVGLLSGFLPIAIWLFASLPPPANFCLGLPIAVLGGTALWQLLGGVRDRFGP
jgi:hypothetical protein